MIYIAIMLIALLVLGWDKLVNPDSATDPQEAQATQETPQGPQNDLTQWTNSPFVQRVLNPKKESQQNALGRNIFVPSDQFQKNIHKPSADAPETDDYSDLLLTTISKGFKKDHVLINGEIVKIGEAIGPYRLVQINREEVILHRDKKHITLPIRELGRFNEGKNGVKISVCNLSDCFSN